MNRIKKFVRDHDEALITGATYGVSLLVAFYLNNRANAVTNLDTVTFDGGEKALVVTQRNGKTTWFNTEPNTD